MAAIAPSSVEAVSFLAELRNSGNTLGVLVIGEAGSGKTTLIDNLQLEADENSGVVTVYDANGLETAQAAWEKINKHDKWVVIFCIPLTETRMRASLIRTFQEYHELGINWRKTVFALTFADAMPIPKSIKQNPASNPAKYFNQHTQEWDENIRKVFREQICGNEIVSTKIFPATSCADEKLPNGNEWFDLAWSEIIETASRNLVNYLVDDSPNSASPPSKVWIYIFITLFVIAALVFGFFVGGGIGAGIGWAEGDVIGVSLGISFGAGLGIVMGMLTGFCAALCCLKCVILRQA